MDPVLLASFRLSLAWRTDVRRFLGLIEIVDMDTAHSLIPALMFQRVFAPVDIAYPDCLSGADEAFEVFFVSFAHFAERGAR